MGCIVIFLALCLLSMLLLDCWLIRGAPPRRMVPSVVRIWGLPWIGLFRSIILRLPSLLLRVIARLPTAPPSAATTTIVHRIAARKLWV